MDKPGGRLPGAEGGQAGLPGDGNGGPGGSTGSPGDGNGRPGGSAGRTGDRDGRPGGPASGGNGTSRSSCRWCKRRRPIRKRRRRLPVPMRWTGWRRRWKAGRFWRKSSTPWSARSASPKKTANGGTGPSWACCTACSNCGRGWPFSARSGGSAGSGRSAAAAGRTNDGSAGRPAPPAGSGARIASAAWPWDGPGPARRSSSVRRGDARTAMRNGWNGQVRRLRRRGPRTCRYGRSAGRTCRGGRHMARCRQGGRRANRNGRNNRIGRSRTDKPAGPPWAPACKRTRAARPPRTRSKPPWPPSSTCPSARRRKRRPGRAYGSSWRDARGRPARASGRSSSGR